MTYRWKFKAWFWYCFVVEASICGFEVNSHLGLDARYRDSHLHLSKHQRNWWNHVSGRAQSWQKLRPWPCLKDCRVCKVWSISLFLYLLFVTIKRNRHVYLQFLANFLRRFPSGWLVGLIHLQPTETGFETGDCDCTLD